MKSIIKDIFEGEKGNYENFPFSEEYENLCGVIMDTEDEVLTKLPKELKEKVKEWSQAQYDMLQLGLSEAYTEGVKIGMKLAFEVMGD